MSADYLPYGRHDISEEDIAEVIAALRSDRLTQGPYVERFEGAMTDITGARHVIVCGNGTEALHMALVAAGIGPGDLIIVPAITFLATANTVLMTGAHVVFSDVNPATGLMEPSHVESAINALSAADRQTVKAVMPVHMGGQVYDPQSLAAIADKYGLVVIEDASHALGSSYTYDGGALCNVGACTHSSLATFSFHPVKSIAMGEGGAVATNSNEMAKTCRMIRNHGITRDVSKFQNKDLALDANGAANPWYYEMQMLGNNYRATDIHCALGVSQLSRISIFYERRQILAARYRELLAEYNPPVKPVIDHNPGRTFWHLFVALIDFEALGRSRADVMRKLNENGIGTQVHYIPVSDQPYYQGLYGHQNFPGAQLYYDQCLSLPLYPAMALTDVDRVVDELTSALGLTNR